MKSNLKNVSKVIANQLMDDYYNYYCTVYFDFIVDAVENTLKDYEMEIPPLSDIHKHIKENYI